MRPDLPQIGLARLMVGAALSALTLGGLVLADDSSGRALRVRPVRGQAELATAEIHGVGAGEFRPELWQSGRLHFQQDVRSPLLVPRQRGVYRNIYAPSAVEVAGGWRVFYGAWDGVDTPNDRIYSVETRDFLDFTDRRTVIEHGAFIHVCNVNVLRLPDGQYRMMCTVYPDERDRNKPALFTSPDGHRWNGAPAPYAAQRADIISMEGYPGFADADINGMNVLLYEGGEYRLYFNNFRDFGRVYRASSRDAKHFRFDGPALEAQAVVNDVKRVPAAGQTHYLMGLHMNGDRLWYSLSRDGMKFGPLHDLARNRGPEDRYIVAVGWVMSGRRVVGFLYGAGAVPSLDRNRIFARWLQRRVVFEADDGTRYEPTGAIGPDRQVLPAPGTGSAPGRFTVYAEDGVTVLGTTRGELRAGQIYVVSAGK